MKNLQMYWVLYRECGHLPGDPPLAMRFWAEDADHAEEQAENEPTVALVVWVVQAVSIEEAYADYWDSP